MIKLSLAISCYKPSKKSIENVEEILSALKDDEEIELSYFLNGLSNNKYEDKLIETLKNNNSRNIIFKHKNVNIGVGNGVKFAIDSSNGRHVLLLGDDDLIKRETIYFLKNKSSELDFDIAHQYLQDSTYKDSSYLEKVVSKNNYKYYRLLAEIGFRSGALPGFMFRKSLIEKSESWQDKLYPWIKLVFHPEVSIVALLKPPTMIKIDKGPDINNRFSDRVPRGHDYGFVERISYSKNTDILSFRTFYNSLCYLWIIKLSKEILSFSKEKYENLMKKNNINFFISKYIGKIVGTKTYIIFVLFENPKIMLGLIYTYFKRLVDVLY